MVLNTSIPKVICSVSDSFFGTIHPLCEWAVQQIGPVFGTEFCYHYLRLEGRFAFARPKQILIQYSVNSSTPNCSSSISQALFTLYQNDFRSSLKIDPV